MKLKMFSFQQTAGGERDFCKALTEIGVLARKLHNHFSEAELMCLVELRLSGQIQRAIKH